MDQIDSFRLFVAIAEQRSLSAVARQRDVAPSTVTLVLQRLEDQVSTRLVNRTTRRLSLTADGESFLAECRRILESVDAALEGYSEHGPLHGTIRLTASNDFGRTHVAGIVHRFMQDHPAIRAELVLSDQVLDLVAEGFDIGIRSGKSTDPRFQSRRLLRGRRVICAAPSYWEAHGKPETPRDLVSHNCLVLERPGAPQSTWRFRSEDGEISVKISGSRTCNDGEVLHKWAISGGGIILKADWDVAADIVRNRLETALDAYCTEEISLYAVHPAGARTPRRIRRMIDFLAEEIGQLASF
ncbi:MAG: LysR family transcriptional regulator [Alphaproteobacteria bacterium]|nr:LysR family transcriptional regulator [Alphaproteobacteria bacterium]